MGFIDRQTRGNYWQSHWVWIYSASASGMLMRWCGKHRQSFRNRAPHIWPETTGVILLGCPAIPIDDNTGVALYPLG